MLGTGAEPTDEQGSYQKCDTVAEAGQDITQSGKHGAEGEDRRRTETCGQKARRDLKAGQRARKHGLHESERGEAEPEFTLPDRQQNVDEVGISVMQRMRAAGDAQRAPLLGFSRRRDLFDALDGGAHVSHDRRPTKLVLTNDIITSPFWFTPVDRNVNSPCRGRLRETRVSITSLA